MCSCSVPSSSSSTTIKVSFFFWKSSFIIFGQKNKPILLLPSYTRIPIKNIYMSRPSYLIFFWVD